MTRRHTLYRCCLLALLFVTPSSYAGGPPEAPILRLETGRHTAAIRDIATDAEGRWVATASDDKSLRLWDGQSGELLHTYRLPIGNGNEGVLNSVAMSPTGEWLAAAGGTGYEWDKMYSIYIINRTSGALQQRISGLKGDIFHLCSSADGRGRIGG